jgi:hypothetical protein
MSEGLSQFTISQRSSGYWRVTFSNRPLSLLDPDTILELQRLTDLIEGEDTLRVVVFDSARASPRPFKIITQGRRLSAPPEAWTKIASGGGISLTPGGDR